MRVNDVFAWFSIVTLSVCLGGAGVAVVTAVFFEGPRINALAKECQKRGGVLVESAPDGLEYVCAARLP